MKPWDEYTEEDDKKFYEDIANITTPAAVDSEETNNLKVQLRDMEAATLTAQEELQLQKSLIIELQEKLKKEEEEKKALHSLVDQLRSEVATENRLRQAAEDERGMNLVFLKLEMGTQALAAKDREENLQNELAKVKSKLEKERQTFEAVNKKSKVAYDKVVREKQHISKEINDNFAKLRQLQNMDKAEHEKEKWHLLDKMARLRNSHQNELDRQAKERAELQTALEKAQEEIRRYCDWEKEKDVKTTEELKKSLQGEQEKHQLLMEDKQEQFRLQLQDKEEHYRLQLQDKEEEFRLHVQDKEEEFRLHVQDKEEHYRLQLHDKEEQFRLQLQDKEEQFRLQVQDKEEQFRLQVQDKEEEFRLQLQDKEKEHQLKEEEHRLMLQDKEKEHRLMLQKVTELEKRMQKIIKRKWYQRLFNHSS